MPDLSAPVGALLDLFGPSVKVGLGVLMRTTAGALVLAGVTAAGAAYMAADGSALRGFLVALVVLSAGVVLSLVVSVQRGVGKAAVHGLRSVSLGRKVVGVVFERLLGVDESGAHGERGGRVARAAESLPLKQAQERLERVVHRLVGETDGSGLRAWFKRLVFGRLVHGVARVTLAEFREADQKHGGVDLVRVRGELEAVIDEKLSAQVERAVDASTVVSAFLFLVAALVLSFGARQLSLGL